MATRTSAGRGTRRFRKLSADLRMQRRPCCFCHQPIDYTLRYPHPASFSVEHIKGWADHPELREDPANLDAAHKACNESNGKRTPSELTATPTLGARSRTW